MDIYTLALVFLVGLLLGTWITLTITGPRIYR